MTRIGQVDIYSFNKTHAPTGFDSTIQHLEKRHCRVYGVQYIKQHFDACKSKTGVLNKPEKSRNMIAAPKRYDSKEKHLGEHTLISS